MKKLRNLILICMIALFGCTITLGIQNKNEAKSEVEIILKDLDINHDDVNCIKSENSNVWNCVISEKEPLSIDQSKIIGTATCKPFDCSIFLR